MGVSFGVKGLRYSTNSRTGSRATIGILGTGISYSTSAYKRNSELKKLQKEQHKMEELQRNQLEVELYENKIDMIKSIHKECDKAIDWNEIEKSDPPFNLESGEKGYKELKAIRELENYNPSLMDKMLGKKDKKIDELKSNIEKAKIEDIEAYKEWEYLTEFAKRINNGDTDAYFEVIDDFKPLDDLLEFGSGFEFFWWIK